MINFSHESFIEHEHPRPLLTTNTTALEDGMILIGVSEDGQEAMAPCVAAASQNVKGVLILSIDDQPEVPTLEQVTVPASPGPYTVTLAQAPSAATERLVVGGVALASPTDYTITGNVVTFSAAQAGNAVDVFYRHQLSPQQLARRGGRRSNNRGGETQYDVVTLGHGNCRVFISNFETEQAYVVGDSLLTAAAGRCTTAAGGTAFGKVFAEPALLDSPGFEQLFLGVEFDL